jgi:hypothetical protein
LYDTGWFELKGYNKMDGKQLRLMWSELKSITMAFCRQHISQLNGNINGI